MAKQKATAWHHNTLGCSCVHHSQGYLASQITCLVTSQLVPAEVWYTTRVAHVTDETLTLAETCKAREPSSCGRERGTSLSFVVCVSAECDMGIQFLGVDACTRPMMLKREVRPMLSFEQPQQVDTTMGTHGAIEANPAAAHGHENLYQMQIQHGILL